MVRLSALLILLPLATATAATPGPPAARPFSDSDAQKAADLLLAAYNTAALGHDAAGKAALYTKDAIIVTPNGLITGADAIMKYLVQGLNGYHPDPSRIQRVKALGERTIVAIGTWSGMYDPAGSPKVGGYWTYTTVRQGRAWKIRVETWNYAGANDPNDPNVKK